MLAENHQAGSQGTGSFPSVSVIMPVFNEERYIAETLRTVFEQDYPPERFEVIIADGMSTDRTREILKDLQSRHPRLRVIDNPKRIVSPGLNCALESAKGEIIVRFDGHCVYPRDFLRRVVLLREETGADNAGGILVPSGRNYVSKSIASAYFSPLGIGGAQRGHRETDRVRVVDTVHGGCWRRDRLLAVGKFDEEMVRNQDDELSFRIRKAGGRIVQSSAIRVEYWVRDSYRKLFLQFAQYGYWKVKVVEKHPQQANLRHFIPALFVCAVFLAAILALFTGVGRWGLAALLLAYIGAISAEGLRQASRTQLTLWPGITFALVVMQVGYGTGFLVGLARKFLGALPTDSVFERVTR